MDTKIAPHCVLPPSLSLPRLLLPPYLVCVGPHRLFDRLIFSCFNAFSRVDVRVDVKIPGGVNAYLIDLRGERYVVSFLLTVLTHPIDGSPKQTRSPRLNLATNIPLCRPPRNPVL